MFPELSMMKFAAVAAITEPTTVGESIERSCLAFGTLGAMALAKKEAGLLTEADSKLIRKVAKVCRNTNKFARVLKNATDHMDGNDALHSTISDLAYEIMSSKVAYKQAMPMALFTREFGSLTEERLEEISGKFASLCNVDRLAKIADIVGDDSVDMEDTDDEGEDIERQMRERMKKDKEQEQDVEEDEDMEGAGELEGTIPPDVLAELLQRLNSSYFEPLNEGMGMEQGEESDTSEVARQLSQLGMGGEQPDSIAPILAALAHSGQNA